MKNSKLTYFLSMSCAFYACINMANANKLETHCVINAVIQEENGGAPRSFKDLLTTLGKYNGDSFEELYKTITKNKEAYPDILSSEFSFDFTQRYYPKGGSTYEEELASIKAFYLNGQNLTLPNEVNNVVKFNITKSSALDRTGWPDSKASSVSEVDIEVNYVRKKNKTMTSNHWFTGDTVKVKDTWTLKPVHTGVGNKKEMWEIVITRPSDRDKGQGTSTDQIINLKPDCTVKDIEASLAAEREKEKNAKDIAKQEALTAQEKVKANEGLKYRRKLEDRLLNNYKEQADASIGAIKEIVRCEVEDPNIKKLKPIIKDYFNTEAGPDKGRYFGWKTYNNSMEVTSLWGNGSWDDVAGSFSIMDLGKGLASNMSVDHRITFKTNVKSKDSGIGMQDTWVFDLTEYGADEYDQHYRNRFNYTLAQDLTIHRHSIDGKMSDQIIHMDDVRCLVYEMLEDRDTVNEIPKISVLKTAVSYVNDASKLKNN